MHDSFSRVSRFMSLTGAGLGGGAKSDTNAGIVRVCAVPNTCFPDSFGVPQRKRALLIGLQDPPLLLPQSVSRWNCVVAISRKAGLGSCSRQSQRAASCWASASGCPRSGPSA